MLSFWKDPSFQYPLIVHLEERDTVPWIIYLLVLPFFLEGEGDPNAHGNDLTASKSAKEAPLV